MTAVFSLTAVLVAMATAAPVSTAEVARVAGQAYEKNRIEAGLKRLGVDGGYEIVVADSPDIVENTAAEELKKYFGKAGLNIGIVPESKAHGSKRFLLGRESNLAAIRSFEDKRAVNIRNMSAEDDGFHLKQVGKDIVIAGANPRGVLYGVYEFEDIVNAGANGSMDVRKVPFFSKRLCGPGHYLNQVSEDHLEERVAYLARCRMNATMLGSGCTLGTLRDWVQSDVFPSMQPRADLVRKIKTVSALYRKYGIATYLMLWEPALAKADIDKFPPEALGIGIQWGGKRKTLCVSSPIVQNYYRNLMGNFVREYPDVKGVLFYNLDGDAFICTPALCPRCQDVCKDSPPDRYNPWETQASLVTLLTEAAKKERADFDFCFWGMVHYQGEQFKKLVSAARVDSLASTWTGGDATLAISARPELLDPGFVFQQKLCAERNIPLVLYHSFSNYEFVPKSMPYPFHVADSLAKSKGWGCRSIFDITGPEPAHNPINTLVAKAFMNAPDQNPEKFLAALATQQFGPASGPLMYQAWEEIRKAIDVWIDMPYGPLMGSMFFINPAINQVVFPRAFLPQQSISGYYNGQVQIRIKVEPFKSAEFQKFMGKAFLDKMVVMSTHYAKAAEYAKQVVAAASDNEYIGICYYEGAEGRPTCKEYAELNYASIVLADFACRMQCNVLRAYHLEMDGNAARDQQIRQAKDAQFVDLVRQDLAFQERFSELLTGFAAMKPCYRRTSLRDEEIAGFLARTKVKSDTEKAFLATKESKALDQ